MAKERAFYVQFSPLTKNKEKVFINIQKKQLHFTNVFDLNDPNELNYVQNLYWNLKDTLKESNSTVVANILNSAHRKLTENKACRMATLQKMINHLDLEETLKEEFESDIFQNSVSIEVISKYKELFILHEAYHSIRLRCMSKAKVFENDAAQLMFSHYADRQRGIALIYESPDNNRNIEQVNYSKCPNRETCPHLEFDYCESCIQKLCKNCKTISNDPLAVGIKIGSHCIEHLCDQCLASYKRSLFINEMSICNSCTEKLCGECMEATKRALKIIKNPAHKFEREAQEIDAVMKYCDETDRAHTSALLNLFLQKSNLWEYENECRIFNTGNECEPEQAFDLRLKAILYTHSISGDDLNRLKCINRCYYDSRLWLHKITLSRKHYKFELANKACDGSRDILNWLQNHLP